MEKVWVEIKGFKNYIINSSGTIINTLSGEETVGYKHEKRYVSTKLVNDFGERKHVYIHRLVYIAFGTEQLRDDEQVNHKDGNKLNNHISNLERTTRSSNMKHAIKTGLKSVHRCKVLKMDEDDNIVHEYNSMLTLTKETDISRAVAIRLTKTNSVHTDGFKYIIEGMTAQVDPPKEFSFIPEYMDYCITPDGTTIYNFKRKINMTFGIKNEYKCITLGKKFFYVHQLVARTFLDPPAEADFVVNHKDGNKLNNHEDNLEWISNKDNVIHGLSLSLRSDQKPVFVYDYYFNFLGIEPSPADVMKKYPTIKDRGSMQNVLSGKKKSVNDYRVSYTALEDPRKTVSPESSWKRCPYSDKYDVSSEGEVFSWHTLSLVKGKGKGWYKFGSTTIHKDGLIAELF